MTKRLTPTQRQLRTALITARSLHYFCTRCNEKKYSLTEAERRLLEDLHEAYKKCLIFIGMALL